MSGFDWCISRDTSGRETTRTTHDWRFLNGVQYCQLCRKVKR